MSRRSLGCLFETVETLVLTFVLFLAIQTFVAQPYQVEQWSMENSLQPGQYVLVDKLTPRLGPYHRGDVVVLAPPPGADQTGNNTPFIKRVIGLPGDCGFHGFWPPCFARIGHPVSPEMATLFHGE